jgi:hypothetical protein
VHAVLTENKCIIDPKKGLQKEATKTSNDKEEISYMLSPLIMYRPSTSCWTPSCKCNHVSHKAQESKCTAKFSCAAEIREYNEKHTCSMQVHERNCATKVFHFNTVVQSINNKR